MEDRVYAVDTVTRDVVGDYASYEEAGKAHGVLPCRVRRQCENLAYPSRFCVVFRHASDYRRDELCKAKKVAPIAVIRGNKLRCFHYPEEAARAFRVSRDDVLFFLEAGHGMGCTWIRFQRGLDGLLEELRQQ